MSVYEIFVMSKSIDIKEAVRSDPLIYSIISIKFLIELQNSGDTSLDIFSLFLLKVYYRQDTLYSHIPNVNNEAENLKICEKKILSQRLFYLCKI